MKDWLTAREIAAEQLPDTAHTERGMQVFALREGWNDNPAFARKRSGRGGGMEYHIRLLPLTALVAYKRRHLTLGIVDLPPAANDAPASSDSDSSRREALNRDARLAVLKLYDRFRDGFVGMEKYALQTFVLSYNNRSLHVEDWLVTALPQITRDQVRRWSAKKRRGKALGFDRGAARKGKGILDTANDGAVKAFVLALIATKPHLAAEAVQKQVRGEFRYGIEIVSKGARTVVDVPPVRTVQNFLKRLKDEHRPELLKLTHPDLFRSTMALSGTGSLGHVTRPNQMWQIDASPVDALCTDGRQTVYACIDVATRRTIFYLSPTPTAEAVGLLIRRAILEWGVPDEIKCDNGSDFMAAATQRLCASLDITLTPSDPYSPEQKGFVERVIKTFQHGPIHLVPGYVGHSVADRKAIENRKSFARRRQEDDAATFAISLTGAELQAVCDEWAEVDYQHRPHGGFRGENAGKTPFQVAAENAATVRRVDVRALDILLAPVAGKDGTRTVTKFGIRIENHHYIHETILPGRKVFARRDPKDVGCIIVFDVQDGRFLGEAVCAELAGIDPKTWLKAKKELRSEYLAERLRDIRSGMRRIASGTPLHERALEVARRDMPNVTALPKRQIAHVTPAIEAAIDATETRGKAPSAARLSDSASKIHETLKAEAESDVAAPPAVRPTTITTLDTPATRFRRALDIEAAIALDQIVAPGDLLWLGGYREGSEYQSRKAMREDFGDWMKV